MRMIRIIRGEANGKPLLFSSGQIVITPDAQESLTRAGVAIETLLDRHFTGDGGDLRSEDVDANTEAIAGGMRVFSSYPVGAGRIWILTEADRSCTTVMEPDDY